MKKTLHFTQNIHNFLKRTLIIASVFWYCTYSLNAGGNFQTLPENTKVVFYIGDYDSDHDEQTVLSDNLLSGKILIDNLPQDTSETANSSNKMQTEDVDYKYILKNNILSENQQKIEVMIVKKLQSDIKEQLASGSGGPVLLVTCENIAGVYDSPDYIKIGNADINLDEGQTISASVFIPNQLLDINLNAEVGLNDNPDLTSGIADNPTDIINEVTVYPNPAVNNITVNLGSEYDAVYSISIHNAIGSNVMSVEKSFNKEESLNIEGLPDGIYFVSVIGQNDKVIVKRFYKN